MPLGCLVAASFRVVFRCGSLCLALCLALCPVVSRGVFRCVTLSPSLPLSLSLPLSPSMPWGCCGAAVGLLWLSPFPIPNLSWFSPFAHYSGGLPPCHYDFAQVVKFYIA